MSLPSTKAGSNAAALSKYLSLEQPDTSTQATYIWIDGKSELRAKTRTLSAVPQTAAELPVWNFDGSSTYQADGSNADVYLMPVRLYRDPFRLGTNRLVLCETVAYDGAPTRSNTRRACVEAMSQAADQEPWFGIEQEFFLMDGHSRTRPLGWPAHGVPDPVVPYYTGTGTGHVVARDLINIHYAACLYAGVQMDGINAEGCLGQWEFQVGPCAGVRIGDDLTMARYLLQRIAEDYHIGVTFHPKPVSDSLFGSGAHTNFSTKAMRSPRGLVAIEEAIPKLERNHRAHIVQYDLNGGADNASRLVEGPVSAPMDTFSAGHGRRNVSVRIPTNVLNEGRGYLEDRRPASNVDPYIVAKLLVQTVCLNQVL